MFLNRPFSCYLRQLKTWRYHSVSVRNWTSRSKLVSVKNLGFKIENCDTRQSEVFKNKKYPEILKEKVWVFAWDQCLSNAKFWFKSLLNFQIFKTFTVPQFSLLNAQIFGTYKFWHGLCISDSHLQSANVRFSISSGSVRKVYCFLNY